MDAASSTAPGGLFVLTGAPGSGKTAILDRLGADLHRIGEPAREVIAEQRAIDGPGTSDRDAGLFVALLLQRSIDKYEDGRLHEGPVLFDRGVPDCVAYAVVLGVDPEPSIRASATYRYRPEVLLLEPWEDIYTTDDERTMSFAQTLPFHRALVDAYADAGYLPTPVPRGTVDERVAFVRDFVYSR